ncbi:MAG: D-glycero-beta-D-manno-heptose-7-phosphate kinase [Candidatus Syntrophosphaera sp.]|nr:D-glycero-beta-D-manno-heptose-7-phosphate kinase [Candidatus Syntrophosphaera sp.]
MIRELLDKFRDKKVLVLGDVMLDQYLWGRVERISPEAPVPILEVCNEEFRLGGAANAALNVRSLGAEAILVGITGEDQAASNLRKLMAESQISSDGLIAGPSRKTTLKTRIGAVNQQIVRIDHESQEEIGAKAVSDLKARLEILLPGCQALIIEDYNKGLMTSEVIGFVLKLAARQGIPVAVDPKYRNFLAYQGVDIFKPNFRELQTVKGEAFEGDEAFFTAARELRTQLEVKNLIVTKGSLGMYIFDGDGQPLHLPTAAREVYDVSGAGDTVISALTLAYISGADIRLAAQVANHAAGVACGIMGTACVSPEQLLASYNEQR